MTLSTLSTTALEDVANETNTPKWFQLYIYRDRSVTQQLVKRAEESGFKALALTVDTPILGRREADLRNGFRLPENLSMANFEKINNEKFSQGTKASSLDKGASAAPISGLGQYVSDLLDPHLTWESLAELRAMTNLPIILKGIQNPEDIRTINNHYSHLVDAIWVSNHGGRQLDSVPAGAEVLSEILAEVNGKMDVFVDGGFYRGVDIFKVFSFFFFNSCLV